MTVRPGFPAVSGAATFQDIRRGLAGTVVKSAAGALRTGILPIGTGPLMVGTASMVVNVQTCVVVLDRNGVVFLPNDGVQAVQLSSAPSSGSRWSIVYAKQRETEAPFSDTVAGPLIDKVESTNSETAARNLLPAGARELGVWKVDAGATTTNAATGVAYTETAPYTAMEGGIVLLRNQAEQDAWAPHDGSDAIRMDTGIAYRRIAGVWRQQTSARHAGVTGSAIVNIDVPQAATALPAGVQIKTGQLTVGTTVDFGNEYFPVVLFDVAFPTAALSVFITPVYQGIVTGPQMAIGIDTLNVGGFRALIKGSGNPWVRSFVWTAIGY